MDGVTPQMTLGMVCFAVCVVRGYLQLSRCTGAVLPDRSFRLSMVVQTMTALAALALLRLDSLAVLLIVIVAQIVEREAISVIVWWLVIANLAVCATFLSMYSTIGAFIRLGMQVGFQLFAISVSMAFRSERQVREEVAALNAELMATRRLLEHSTRSQERLRISRELHDVVGHRLTALKLNLESAVRRSQGEVSSGDNLTERLSLCRDLSGALLSEIRGAVHQLRSADGVDLHRAFEPLAEQLLDTEIHVDIAADLSVTRIEVAETIIRCSQEAITNALKHGSARNVWVRVFRDADSVVLSVRDDGRGGTDSQTGYGLQGMMERARELGGALHVMTSVRAGWELRLELPQEATS